MFTDAGSNPVGCHMKNNNFLLYITILAIVSIAFSLGNSHELDQLRQVLDTIQANMELRAQGGNQTSFTILTELLRIINDSNLQPDSIRFLFEYLFIHLNNLPTVSEFQDLVTVIIELESKMGSGGFDSFADYLSKHGGPPGPDPSAGGSSSMVSPTK